MNSLPMLHPTFRRWLVVAVAAGFPTVASSEPPAVAVEAERTHRTVLQNDYVQAMRVTLPAGESNDMHVHAHDDAAVMLSVATIANETLGKAKPPGQPVAPGGISVRENGKNPLTHRIHNVGTTTFDVVDVQILQRPAGPESPAFTTPAAEHGSLRVYRFELSPGASSAPHTHARPYVVVAATDMALRTASPGQSDATQTLETGYIQWADAGVTHTLTNSGNSPAILVEIELK
jgi:quercetin dioxygenase-like cupin family protein